MSQLTLNQRLATLQPQVDLTLFESSLGSVDLSRLNLQQSVWYLGKAEPMQCGYPHKWAIT